MCETTLCYNGGKCLDIPGSFRCDCAAGFVGANCRVNLDECDPNPCFGGGHCKDGVNSFTCTCTKERYGALCESKSNHKCCIKSSKQIRIINIMPCRSFLTINSFG